MRSYSAIIRAVVAIIAFGVAFAAVDMSDLQLVFSRVRIDLILLLLALAAVMIWVSCIKWQLFVRASGYEVSVWHLMKLYTIGYFFNSFLPSYVGGDIARSLHLGAHVGSKKSGFATTLLERFTGLLAMSLLGTVFVVIGTQATKGVEIAILIVTMGVLVAALILFSRSWSNRLASLIIHVLRLFGRKQLIKKTASFFEKANEAFEFARNDIGLFLRAMMWSLVFHMLTVVNTYVAARAIGWDNPDLAGLFVVVPLVLLVGMAPITPSGLGIQEGAFLFFLIRVGATNAEGLGVGILLRIKVLLIAGIGGVLWLCYRPNSINHDNNGETCAS